METFKTQHPVALGLLAYGHVRQPHTTGDGGVGFTGTAIASSMGTLHDRIGW
jgi:hypothetical protein